MVAMRNACSRETRCSGPMTRPDSVRRVTATYIARNGLNGFRDLLGFSLGILHDFCFSARWVRGVPRNFCRTQGRRVQHLDLARTVLPVENDGMLRRRSVQFGSCGQSSLTQPREVDPGNLYPLVFGRALSLLSNPLLNFRDGTELHKRLHGFVPRHADGVHVSLDQAWHDCLAASIDHPRPITDQLLHFGIRTHSHKAALADSGSFDNRGVRINRHDFAIQHDEIGRLLSSWHDLANQESTQGQSTRLWASHRLAENTKWLELCQQVCRAGRTGGAQQFSSTDEIP